MCAHIFVWLDILLNNNCEVFNKYILDTRELPILSMLERIKCQLMTRHYTKQKELAQFAGSFCHKIRAKVNKNAEFANLCFALPSGQGVFQVQIREYSHIVDIFAKTCDCRRWQLTGVPCCMPLLVWGMRGFSLSQCCQVAIQWMHSTELMVSTYGHAGTKVNRKRLMVRKSCLQCMRRR